MHMPPLPLLAAVELTLEPTLAATLELVVEVVVVVTLWLVLGPPPPLPPTALVDASAPPFPAPPGEPPALPLPPPLEEQAPRAPSPTSAEQAIQPKVRSIIQTSLVIP
jgi:hypothetical protein